MNEQDTEHGPDYWVWRFNERKADLEAEAEKRRSREVAAHNEAVDMGDRLGACLSALLTARCLASYGIAENSRAKALPAYDVTAPRGRMHIEVTACGVGYPRGSYWGHYIGAPDDGVRYERLDDLMLWLIDELLAEDGCASGARAN